MLGGVALRRPSAPGPRPLGQRPLTCAPSVGRPAREPGRVTSADAGARPLRTLRDRQATGRARCPVPRRRASRSGLAACPEGVQASAHTAALCSRTTLPRELRAARRTRSPRCRRPCRSSPAASCSGGSTPGPPTPPRSVLARGRPSRRCPVRHEPPRASCPPRSDARSAARRGHGARVCARVGVAAAPGPARAPRGHAPRGSQKGSPDQVGEVALLRVSVDAQRHRDVHSRALNSQAVSHVTNPCYTRRRVPRGSIHAADTASRGHRPIARPWCWRAAGLRGAS